MAINLLRRLHSAYKWHHEYQFLKHHPPTIILVMPIIYLIMLCTICGLDATIGFINTCKADDEKIQLIKIGLQTTQ